MESLPFADDGDKVEEEGGDVNSAKQSEDIVSEAPPIEPVIAIHPKENQGDDLIGKSKEESDLRIREDLPEDIVFGPSRLLKEALDETRAEGKEGVP